MIISQSIYAQRIDWSQPQYNKKELKELQKRIIKGDTTAFFHYMFYGRASHESLSYALFMANNYHYPWAFYWVYELTLSFYREHHLQIDSSSYSLAFQYLHQGAKLGDVNCIDALAHIYYFGNRYVSQDTCKAKEIFIKQYTNSDIKERRWESFKQTYQKSFEAKEERY